MQETAWLSAQQVLTSSFWEVMKPPKAVRRESVIQPMLGSGELYFYQPACDNFSLSLLNDVSEQHNLHLIPYLLFVQMSSYCPEKQFCQGSKSTGSCVCPPRKTLPLGRLHTTRISGPALPRGTLPGEGSAASSLLLASGEPRIKIARGCC